MQQAPEQVAIDLPWSRMPAADEVMRPIAMGAVWPTRHSFARTLIRHMYRHDWRIRKASVDLDRRGRGEAVYEIATHCQPLYFVVFSTTISESEREDRVIAERWDVTAALCEGDLTPRRLDLLRRQVPLQERGRVDAGTLVLTRANRSARFFDAAVEALSRGRQPGKNDIAAAGYLLRSTAFYGNGKFGTKPFEALGPDHPVGVSYRAQMLAAWLLREFSLDLVQTCAGHQRASCAAMDPVRKRNIGIGNATGLGMVPFFVKHPGMIGAWATMREAALVHVLDHNRPTDSHRIRLKALLRRAQRHFEERADLKRSPFTPATQLAEECSETVHRLAEQQSLLERTGNWRPLYEWAQESLSQEGSELARSLLCELDDGMDAVCERLTSVDEAMDTEPAMPLGELQSILARDYDWVDAIDPDDADERHYFWFVSENNEEPRRGIRGVDPGAEREQPFDIAFQAHALHRALASMPEEAPCAELLLQRPDLRGIVERVQALRGARYGETRANLLARSFVPLDLQKFKLSMYGMQNHDPKSTDWLRVTLFQGAPSAGDLGRGEEGDWMFPIGEDGDE